MFIYPLIIIFFCKLIVRSRDVIKFGFHFFSIFTIRGAVFFPLSHLRVPSVTGRPAFMHVRVEGVRGWQSNPSIINSKNLT